ncbi:hypothetical protein PG997_014713 [Apiospora hydei]|uniref:Uncharacterized protein n=1 Tax=Apiospora hydei TaxID=1337664 RepID=A0ABR1UX49_9PEZI
MWIDTCRISKANSVEETESIDSMFKWYRDAKTCVTYLYDVKRGPEPLLEEDETMAADSNGLPNVFRRIDHPGQPSAWSFCGWTLQELIAPHDMQFYNTDWASLGTRAERAGAIVAVTGIAVEYLTGQKPMHSACIAVKMSWMANRATTLEGDIAYSIPGTFDQYLVREPSSYFHSFNIQGKVLSENSVL